MMERVALPQHLRALGFARNPFPQTPDADCYFRTEAIEQQFTEALHCVKAGKGFVLLSGEVGTGKSTFLRCLMDVLVGSDCAVSFVFNTFLQGRDLLLAINRDFGLQAGADLAEDIARLNQYLIEQNGCGRCCAVVIDDAQNLDAASLELLRLLSNLETRQNKLLQIVLSGQPELLVLLRKNESRQLASRIVQHIQLAPLSRSECARYIDFRIARAGTDGRTRLTAAAQRALYSHSHGNPRRMHLIMDRCLYGVAPNGQHEIDKRLVGIAAREGGVASAPHRRFRAWLPVAVVIGMVVCVSLGLSLPSVLPQAQAVATVSAPGAIAPPPELAVKHTFQACLKQLRAEAWLVELENGLNVETRRATLQSLAEAGLALAILPPGLRLPEASVAHAGKLCSWDSHAGGSVLWRPAHLPFDLTGDAHGEAVRWLQTQLAASDLYTEEIDGVSGPRTRAALKDFQRWHGVSADSSVDAWTLFLLEHRIGRLAGSAAKDRTAQYAQYAANRP